MKTLYKVMQHPAYGMFPPTLVDLVESETYANELVEKLELLSPDKVVFFVDTIEWSS
jgi:hypothetical protein